MKIEFWIFTFIFILSGCSQPSLAKVEAPDPLSLDYASYRSGVIQLNGAAEVIEEMHQKASEFKKTVSLSGKKYIERILEQTDEARVCLADYFEDPLPLEKYKNSPPLKQQIVDAANDAIHELTDIYEIIEEAPKNIKFDQIEIFTDESIKNLEESITTLGGKIEE